MTSVAFYVDDSFEGPIFVLAGYVSTPELWEEVFTPRWRQLIASAPHPVSEFKASNCRTGAEGGEFSSSLGWKRSERDAFYREAVGVIADTCPKTDFLGFAAAFIFPGRTVGSWRVMLEEMGFRNCLVHLLSDAMDSTSAYVQAAGDDNGTVRVIYDEKPHFAHLVTEEFPAVKQRLGPRGK